MLLKTNGRTKKRSFYPTMSMIISVLLKVLRKAVFYFQYDSLWKNLKVTSNVGRTHDVYDQKGVSLKREKCCRLFSTGYGQENEALCAAFCTEPTISMMGKYLRANRQFFAIWYVIENKGRSSLASENNGFRTDDVHDREGVNGICQSLAILHVIENKSRSKLAPGSDRCGTHDVLEMQRLSQR